MLASKVTRLPDAAQPLVRCADALPLHPPMAFRRPILVPAGIHRTSRVLARPLLPEKSERSDDLQSGIGPWFRSLADDGTKSAGRPWRKAPLVVGGPKLESGPLIAISMARQYTTASGEKLGVR